MTVADLIEALKAMPQDATVWVETTSECGKATELDLFEGTFSQRVYIFAPTA